MAYSAEQIEQAIVPASATITAAANTADQQNPNCRGVKVVVDITAFSGTSVTFTIKGKDPASGKYVTLLASAALVATGTTVLTVYPGIGVTANVSASDVLPRTWRVEATGTITSVTYSLGAVLIP